MTFEVEIKSPGTAPFHSLIPAHYALGCTFIFCLGVSFLRGFSASAAAFILGLALLLSLFLPPAPASPLAPNSQGRLNMKNFRAALLSVNFFLLFLWVTLPVSVTPGDALLALGPVYIRSEGLWLAAIVSLKANAVLLAFTALLGSRSLDSISAGLRALRLPESLITLLHLVSRHIFTFADEWKRLTTAARLRGFTPRFTMHTYRTTANLLGMLLVNTYTQCERTGQAMRLRGFSGRFPVFLPNAEPDSVTLAKSRALLAFFVLAAASLLALDFLRP